MTDSRHPSPAANGLEPWLDPASKVVMVTGASSGIGRDFCLHLAKSGCKIIAAARRVDRLESLCNEINKSDSSTSLESQATTRAVAVELDVTESAAAIDAAVSDAWAPFGRIDVLINNAGIRGSVSSSLDLSEEEFNDVIRSNLTGMWLVSKCVCARMREAGQGGSVINISSVSGLSRGHHHGSSIYSATKAAINTMTKRMQVMALELGAYNIRVNSISPGIFKSEITEGLMQKPWYQTVTFKMIPLRARGTTDPALISLVRYLIDDISGYVTGNLFVVDAGGTLTGIPIWSSL